MFGALLGALIGAIISFYLNYKFQEYREQKEAARVLYRVAHSAGHQVAEIAITYNQVCMGMITYEAAIQGMTDRGLTHSQSEGDLQCAIEVGFPDLQPLWEEFRSKSDSISQIGMKLAFHQVPSPSKSTIDQLSRLKDELIGVSKVMRQEAKNRTPQSFWDYLWR